MAENISRVNLAANTGYSHSLEGQETAAPASSQSNFSSFMNGVGQLVGGAAQSVFPGLSMLSRASSLVGGSGGGLGGNSDMQALMQQQNEMQQQMMRYSMESNMLSMAHETRMAVVRNMKAS